MSSSNPDSADKDGTTSAEDTSESQPSAPTNRDNPRIPAPPSTAGQIEEKKLIPPPPIIGPDGKELPRPRDAAGRPLPIYLTSDGKPVLDKSGAPIALKFGEDGKPIPLEGQSRPTEKSSGQNKLIVAEIAKPTEKIPKCITGLAVVDIILTLCVTAYFCYAASMAFQKGAHDQIHLAIAVFCLCLCALSGILAILSVQKNQAKFLYTWSSVAVLLMCCLLILTAILPNFKNNVLPSFTFSLVRLVWCLAPLCCLNGSTGTNSSPSGYYYAGSAPGATRYAQGGPQTVVVHQPTVVPTYGYGYGYGSPYYGGGYYSDAADAALLGFAAGSMMGHHHYGGGWGWGGGYYDGGYWDGGFDDFGW